MNEDETVAEMLADDGDDDGVPISRRAALATSLGAVTGAFVLLPGSKSARAAVTAEQLTADGDEITSHDGSIDSIDVDPVIAVAWEGFNTASTDADIAIAFDTAEETAVTVYQDTRTLGGTNGEETFDYDPADLLTEGWSATTFEAGENDTETSTEVTAEVTLEAPAEEISTTVSDTFTVTVVNHPASANVGGEVQTNVESSEEVTTG